VGLQEVLNKIDPDDGAAIAKVKSCLEAIKLDPEFIKITTGGGKNSPGPLNNRINFVAARLKNEFP
jgi:hypothetical protein